VRRGGGSTPLSAARVFSAHRKHSCPHDPTAVRPRVEPAAFLKMSEILANLENWIARNRYSALVQYLGAALAVWVALSCWTLSAALHRHLFVLLLAAVLFTARFLGFGPAVFCSLVSTACLDFFAVPYFGFRIGTSADLERLAAFLAISMFAASMARQKTLAELRADHTTREMAAIVEYSSD